MASDEAAAILAANSRFYAAHEQQDFDAMTSVWSTGDDVACIHPGWPILRGWEQVGESWRRIFAGPGQNRFITTNDQVVIAGDVAWVTLDENMVAGSGETGTVAATNVFRRISGEWKMVHHHGSPVAGRR